MQYICTHIYREGNQVADALSNRGLKELEFCWWDTDISKIRMLIANDKQGIVYRRHVT